MAPATRSQRSAPPPSQIIILDSDSDGEKSPSRRAPEAKRQKTMDLPLDEDIVMLDAPPTPPASVAYSSSVKNAHLKGRKRFAADFADLKAQGLELAGLAVTKIRAGDDEGMIDLVIVDRTKGDARVVGCSIIITDTSEYPKHHSLLTFSDDKDLPERVTNALNALEGAPPRTIGEVLEVLLTSLGGAKPATGKTKSLAAASKGKSFASAATVSDEGEDDEGSDVGYDAYFPGDEIESVRGAGERETQRVVGRMQRDFLEIVSSSYRPGLIPFTPGPFDSASDFALSVSIPTVRLTDTIPAQALVAWDRRLLGSTRARHLVLLVSGLGTAYPPLTPMGEHARQGMRLRFQVGVCGRYKPDRAAAVEAGRTFGLVGKDAEDELREAKERERRAREQAALGWGDGDDSLGDAIEGEATPLEVEVEEEDEGRFERFSLSTSLESLLEAQLVKLIWVRRTYGVGWAGAELMYMHVEREQRAYDDIYTTYKAALKKADKEEAALARLGTLPYDPLRDLAKGEDINFPYTAFCYLMRRLTLCTSYCLVCHNKLTVEFEALKPYVCESQLCAYQYYKHNRGPSLEYEIMHNPETVDLLVSLTYSAAAEGVVDDPLPVGLTLRVPPPDRAHIVYQQATPYQPQPAVQPATPVSYQTGTDGLVDFDILPVEHMRASIAGLIDSLPSVDEMKRHLERKVKPGKSKPRLVDMEEGKILPAAWSVLRWCVGSATAYLEEMSSNEEQCVQGVDPVWRQFRFSVGAPSAEAKFQKALKMAKETDGNAKKYPSLYAFHGSALKNWHSIIRHGLWYRTVTNGRAFGDGVYLAKEAQTSMGHYAVGGRACWRKSKLGPTSCVALAEVVNLPHQFVSSNPHFVIKDTEWIMCRYLLVKGSVEAPASEPAGGKNKKTVIPFVKLDPAQAITLQQKQLQVPEPAYQIDKLVHLREAELVEEDHDATDAFIFEHLEHQEPRKVESEVIELSDDDEPMPPPPPSSKGKKGKGASLLAGVTSAFKGKGSAGASGSGSSSPRKGPPKDDWKHDPAYVQRTMDMLMPPPLDSSPSSTMAVQRELKSMLKEQNKAMASSGGLKELGWYMPPEFMSDNLFQWIVEMHSFDETLPIAMDLKREGVNSLIFEIRFPPTYPIGPPFFRIITPRFLPFIHGGGGHVTGGGSICMDLLTSDGWLPSYSISAVLMQIRMAISNLDPRPARLAQNWNLPYSVGESLAGFKRAAATHGWTVPDGIDKLVR